MKKGIMLAFFVIGFALTSISQCLIQNGGFEQGIKTDPNNYYLYQFDNIPGWYNPDCNGLQTPDLITTAADPAGFVGIPGNIQGPGVYPRNNGQTNNRYARLVGSEVLQAAFTESLEGHAYYTVSCYAARKNWFNCLTGAARTEFTNMMVPVEFVLRKSTNCNVSKVVYRLENLTALNNCTAGSETSVWTSISTTFSLTDAEVATGYDRIEVRLGANSSGYHPNSSRYPVLFDDFCVTKAPGALADFDFVTMGQTYTTVATPFGSMQLTQVCSVPAPGETPVMINGGASQNETSYGIRIEEWNPVSWSALAPPIYDSWQLPFASVPTTDINLQALPGVNMQPGKIYLVTLFVGPLYHSVNGLFRINAQPTLNAGADKTICNGESASVTVTTSNWPVKVYRGSTLVGTYYSNPVNLSPTTTTAYSFRTTATGGCEASDNMTVTVNNCPRASFVFTNSYTTLSEGPTPYGYVPIEQMCNQNIYIDGSASSNENGYWLGISEINITNWSLTQPALYADWYGGPLVPNSINLLTVVRTNHPTFNFQIGQTYHVSLAVGPVWHETSKVFRMIDCTKSGEIVMEELDPATGEKLSPEVTVFPNPTSGICTVDLSEIEAQHVTVSNVLGAVVCEHTVEEDARSLQIDLADLPSGVYLIQLKTNDGTVLKRVVKE